VTPRIERAIELKATMLGGRIGWAPASGLREPACHSRLARRAWIAATAVPTKVPVASLNGVRVVQGYR
jgi:2-keto-3-deoxy-galactonokinase